MAFLSAYQGMSPAAAALLAMSDVSRPEDQLGAFLTVVAIVYVSIFIHELGHAVVGRMAGYLVTSFGLGTARPWCVIPVAGTRVYFCPVRPFQGITFYCTPHRDPTRRQQAAAIAGGILANGSLALLALGAGLVGSSVFWMTVAAINGLMAGLNLIPLQIQVGRATMRSDGWQLLRIWRSGSVPVPAPLLIQTLDAFGPLWVATGDTLALRVYRLCAAEARACLGDLGRAGALLAEAEATPCPEVPGVSALEALVRSEIAIAAGDLDGADAAIDAAEAESRAIGHEGVRFNAATLRAQVRRHRGDARGACDDLAALLDRPPEGRNPSRTAAALAEWLVAAVAADDPEAEAALLAKYERARVVHPSAAVDLAVSTALARSRAGRDDPAGAAIFYRHAAEAVAALAAAWNDPAERSRFLESRAPLLEEAREGLRRAGEAPDDVGRLIRKAEPPTPAEREARDRRLRRLGYPLLLVNTALVAGSIGLGMGVGVSTLGPLVVLPFILGLFTAAGLLYLALDRAVGRLIPTLRASGGAVILMMGCLAWACGLLGLLLVLVDPSARP